MTSASEGFNGWTNRPTWSVYCWLTSEEFSYKQFRALAQNFFDNTQAGAILNREQAAQRDLAETLRDMYDSALSDLLESADAGASVWADMLSASLQSVNFDEIAQALLQEVDRSGERINRRSILKQA
jgi:hypothetical protein